VTDIPEALVRGIGLAELAGAIGVLLPALTRICPVLTPLAALGLAVILALAIPFHILRGEGDTVGLHIVMGALAAIVAWGRWRDAPIPSR
jgi:hypothetical protein